MTRPHRVLLLTQYYPPETGAPQVRLSEMVRWLRRRGFEVEVLTAMPNYPQGRIYDGYRGKLYTIENGPCGRVVHLPVLPSRSPALIPRMASYLSFVLGSLLLGPFLVKRPDVLICESPPLFLGLTAAALKVLFRCRMIFNVSDLWPESAVRMGLHNHPLLIRLALRLERFCYRMADATTGQSPGILRGIQSVHPAGRTELIPNGCDCEVFQPGRRDVALRAHYGLDGKIVVGYAGLIGRAQGIDLMLDLAERLLGQPQIHFLLAGDGPDRERVDRELATRRLRNITFTGWLAKDAMPSLVASFDIALIPLKFHIPGALPSKIYEAMASELPILLAAEGDPKELVQRAEAGVVVEYGNIDQTAAAIVQLARDPVQRARLGSNGRRYVLAHHQRHLIARRLGDLVDSLLGTVPEPATVTRRAA